VPTFTLTDEQRAILSEVQSSRRNLIIHARAGAAKTTTLQLIAEAVAPQPALCLAFNKAIQQEMQSRFPRSTQVKTMNSLGHQAWGRRLGKRLTLDKTKVYSLTINAIKESGFSDTERKELFDDLPVLLDAVRRGKQEGYLPPSASAKPLISEEDFLLALPTELSGLQIDVLRSVSDQSWTQACEGRIDFQDQLLCPALTSCQFPQFPLTLVDEAQDLSHLDHILLKKQLGIDRLIAVGDPYQAVYAFRGADSKSMENLSTKFKCEPLYLTTTFRCGSNIVELAKGRVPDIKARPNAHPGEISCPSSWGPWSIPNSAAIICRNNAPLLRVAINLLKSGRRSEYRGKDVLSSLSKILRKFGDDNLLSASVLEKISDWYESEARRSREKGVLADKRECLTIIAESHDTLGEMLSYLKELENQTGAVQLMTGHKSKGLEFDTVFFLEPSLLRDRDRNGAPTQDPNIRYVIQTRAINNLIHVSLDQWRETEPETKEESHEL